MKKWKWMAVLASALLVPDAFGFGKAREVPVVSSVDLNAYLGRWYELRRLENSFQDKERRDGDGPCFNTMAEYGLLPGGKISVRNSCERASGPEVALARARVVKDSNNAKLKVNFTGIWILEKLGIGNGDYWVLALGPLNEEGLYSWSLVGSPDLSVGWVLARDQDLPKEELERALDSAVAAGYERKQFKEFRR